MSTIYACKDISEWLFVINGRPLLNEVIDYTYDERLNYNCDGTVEIIIRTECLDKNFNIFELSQNNTDKICLGRTRHIKFEDGHFERKCEFFEDVKIREMHEDCGNDGNRFVTYRLTGRVA